MDFKSNTMEYQTSSKFDPFAPICMEKGIVKIHVDEFKTNSSNQSTVEFNIEADPEKWTDITTMTLHGKMGVRVKETDGSWSIAKMNNKVAPINNGFQSAFSSVSIKINDTVIGETNGMTYPYGAYLQTLLSHKPDSLGTILKPRLYCRDSANKLDEPSKNAGWVSRYGEITGGQPRGWELFHVPIHNDLMTIKDKYLPPNIRLQVTFRRASDNFCLQKEENDAGEYKVVFENLSITMERLEVEPEINKKYFQNLKAYVPTFQFTQNVLKTYSVIKDSKDLSYYNIFFGNRLPDKVYLMMVDQDAFSGTMTKNPYNFKNFGFTDAYLKHNSECEPNEPYSFDSLTRCYQAFLENTGTGPLDLNTVPVSLDEYQGGYCILAFNRTPGKRRGISHMKGGQLSINLKTMTGLPNNVTVLVYASYDSKLELVEDKAIVSYI